MLYVLVSLGVTNFSCQNSETKLSNAVTLAQNVATYHYNTELTNYVEMRYNVIVIRAFLHALSAAWNARNVTICFQLTTGSTQAHGVIYHCIIPLLTTPHRITVAVSYGSSVITRNASTNCMTHVRPYIVLTH